MTQFNLSEKNSCSGIDHEFGSFKFKDVKEFIRLLKEDFYERFSPTERKSFEYVIDKLAGEKLI